MKKYIKYTIKGLNITITEQSHLGEEFGKGDSPDSFYASNGIVLSSAGCPENDDDYTFVRGSDAFLDNYPIVCVNASDLEKITAALDEYNEVFSQAT